MKLVPNAISNKIARQGLRLSKNSPRLLFATGVAGMVGSTVLACRATLQVSDIIAITEDDLAVCKDKREQASNGVAMHYQSTGQPATYSERDYQRDKMVIYGQTAGRLLQVYWPSLVLGAASIGCLTKSHTILNERNLALTAAYAAVDEAFTTYRRRVVEKYGEEQDREFRYAYDEVDIIDENGKIHSERRFSDDGMPSMYARFFDEYAQDWSKEPDYNFVFLRCQQKRANDMLIARGHMFLNEVYDMLGLDRTTAGSVVGWVISPDGDNYIDFGIFTDRTTREVRDFINGRNNAILLDFNVDGVIYDKIDTNKERLQWQN